MIPSFHHTSSFYTLPWLGPSVEPRLAGLLRHCAARGIRLLVSPLGMSARQGNKSMFSRQDKVCFASRMDSLVGP